MPNIYVRVNAEGFEAVKNQPIMAKLYYTNGVTEMEVYPLKYHLVEGQEITRAMLRSQ
jgi:hypothetical protein